MLSRKAAKEIAFLFNAISVAKIMLADSSSYSNEAWSYAGFKDYLERWTSYEDRAVTQLHDKFGIDVIGYQHN